MKKIGIVTTHRANNFGAVLQAFSLVSACRELGADAEILDWRCRHFEWSYHRAWRMHRNPLPAIKHLIWFLTGEKSIRRSFDAFRELMPMSEKITARRDLFKKAQAYDAIIVGSDQVWNPINSAVNPLNFDRANLLDFVSPGTKKFAYAASMGTRAINPPLLIPEFVNAWKTFDLITMREHAGAEYVGSQIEKKIETVLDPVLLHDALFWRQYKQPVAYEKGKFVFIYNVKSSSLLRQTAEQYAHEHNLKIVDVIIPSLKPAETYERIGAGPAEFLSYIDDATAVFTNSFHASAFSVIFGKKLFINRANSIKDHNSRFETLLRFASLTGNDVVTRGNEMITEIDCSKSDWQGLDAERERSKNLLKEMVV